MLEFGTITALKEGKELAQVNILGRTSDWLPRLGLSNNFVKVFMPMAVGEQVAVLDDRLILGSLHYKGCDEDGGHKDFKISFADGTAINYDGEILKIDCKKPVQVISDKIELGDNGTGLITGESICHFDGKPHSDCSTVVFASK